MSSDTTAFLAGCAITGVAAVLLLRGGILDAAPRGNPVASSPPATLSTPTLQSSNSDPASSWQLERDLAQQHSITEDLKNQIARQQEATNDLKTAIDQQRNDTDKVLAQLQLRLEEQQRTIDAMTVQQQISTADRFRNTEQFRLTEQSRLATTDQPRIQSTVLWVVGITIIVLAVGGGIILLVLVVLLVQSQRRYPRPVHVIHPMPPPYVFPEQALLPPGPRTRRTNQIEIYED